MTVNNDALDELLYKALLKHETMAKLEGGPKIAAMGTGWFRKLVVGQYPDYPQVVIDLITRNALVRLMKAKQIFPAGMAGYSVEREKRVERQHVLNAARQVEIGEIEWHLPTSK